MTVGRRVARLRISQGESLRDAAERTGVSHSTIARIEKGEVTGSYQKTLELIAAGYGVTLDYLLTGRSSRHAPPVPRLAPEEMATLLLSSGRERLVRTYHYLTDKGPGAITPEAFADSLNVSLPALERGLSGAEPLPPSVHRCLCQHLADLTGLPVSWFARPEGGSSLDRSAPDDSERYLGLVTKAHRAGITPELLAIAVDLLLLRADSPALPPLVEQVAP